jgi:hypothetical protein
LIEQLLGARSKRDVAAGVALNGGHVLCIHREIPCTPRYDRACMHLGSGMHAFAPQIVVEERAQRAKAIGTGREAASIDRARIGRACVDRDLSETPDEPYLSGRALGCDFRNDL